MNTPNEIGLTVFQYLVEAGFNFNMAKFITAQAAHESANFTSQVYKDHNNVFGMKKGDLTDYATYNSLFDCINAYRNYWLRNGYKNNYLTIDNFVSELKQKSYFEASLDNYTKAVYHFYTLYFG